MTTIKYKNLEPVQKGNLGKLLLNNPRTCVLINFLLHSRIPSAHRIADRIDLSPNMRIQRAPAQCTVSKFKLSNSRLLSVGCQSKS